MILSIDPGGTTGVAIYESGQFRSLEIPDGKAAFYRWFGGITDSADLEDLTVVCESFTIPTATASKSRQDDPYMILGYLSGWCLLHSVPLHVQSPGQAKSFSTDSKLRRIGWYEGTKGGHANDAARHLLVYLVTHRSDHSVEDLLATLALDLE